jgi:Predicted membrane protein (DUF2238)
VVRFVTAASWSQSGDRRTARSHKSVRASLGACAGFTSPCSDCGRGNPRCDVPAIPAHDADVWVFSLILTTGGHYTYAEVPVGNGVRDAFNLSRNHFDRVGHFFQGVIPAMVALAVCPSCQVGRTARWLRLADR